MLGNQVFRRADCPPLRLVESLRGMAGERSLSFVDIEAGILCQLTGSEFSLLLEAPQISLAEPLGGGSFLLAAGDRIGVLSSSGVVTWSPSLLPPNQRFNDGTIDSRGRLVVGSMSLLPEDTRAQNKLLLLGDGGEVSTIREGVGLSNGLGVDPYSGDLLHVDTLASTIHRIPLKSKSGKYGRAEICHQFSKDESPDGMVVLDSGDMLVALWGQNALALIAREGGEISRVDVPPTFPTSVWICNDTGTLWMGSASQPREGERTSSIPGGVWFSSTELRQAGKYCWRSWYLKNAREAQRNVV